jgi:hypothetical protein
MPKITLKNDETGQLQDFEPVDAREVLANPDSIYSVPKETREEIGKAPGLDSELNVPQLQGSDVEMQVGLSIEKYGRGNVVKAQPGNVELSPPPPPPSTDAEALVKRGPGRPPKAPEPAPAPAVRAPTPGEAKEKPKA